MYIFKNPGVGGEVTSHQDGSYLHTEPASAIGFWIALEDATLENGCLKFIRASHNNGIHRRYIRNPDKNAKDFLIYDSPEPIYQMSNFTACPVQKGETAFSPFQYVFKISILLGTLIAIHSQVVHRSEPNKSSKSRHAYTFHCIETSNTKYSPDNWLQPSEPFPILYER